jgi:hypothetical protein
MWARRVPHNLRTIMDCSCRSVHRQRCPSGGISALRPHSQACHQIAEDRAEPNRLNKGTATVAAPNGTMACPKPKSEASAMKSLCRSARACLAQNSMSPCMDPRLNRGLPRSGEATNCRLALGGEDQIRSGDRAAVGIHDGACNHARSRTGEKDYDVRDFVRLAEAS